MYACSGNNPCPHHYHHTRSPSRYGHTIADTTSRPNTGPANLDLDARTDAYPQPNSYPYNYSDAGTDGNPNAKADSDPDPHVYCTDPDTNAPGRYQFRLHRLPGGGARSLGKTASVGRLP